MSTVLNFSRDAQGMNAYAPAASTNLYSATLTNLAESHITVPSNHARWIAVFSIQPGCNVWVDLTGGTSNDPVGATLAATTSELNPGPRLVLAGDLISVITTNATCELGIGLYAVP